MLREFVLETDKYSNSREKNIHNKLNYYIQFEKVNILFKF
jgi:hypothetical protein